MAVHDLVCQRVARYIIDPFLALACDAIQYGPARRDPIARTAPC